jgi:hypothetical protein
MGGAPWTRNDKIALAAVVVGILGVITALLFPEVRRWLHLDKFGREHTEILSFDDVSTGSDGYVNATDYLQQHGISISKISQGQVVIESENSASGGFAFSAPSTPNVLTQIGCTDKPVSFSLKLEQPAKEVTFRRARLIAYSPSGISHPAWYAGAFSVSGMQLGHAQEGLIRNEGVGHHEDAQSFTLEGPGIVTIEFSSNYLRDGKPFAGFCGVLIDDLTLVY